MMTADVPITRYPDEPHPNDEHTWKSWWVRTPVGSKPKHDGVDNKRP
jgi:hypothetical protein